MKAKWTKRRRKEELEKLLELLVEAGSINHSSHTILLCDRLSKALFSSKLGLRNPTSFYQFLIELVIAERKANSFSSPVASKESMCTK